MTVPSAMLSFVGARRRTAEEAKLEILDVATELLSESGPSGIRLQEVAARVGVSHPAILHHFGSREGLVQAVVDRALASLQADLLRAYASAGEEMSAGSSDSGVALGLPPPGTGAQMLDRVYEVLADRGHGRLLAWLVLSGYDEVGTDSKEVQAGWKAFADMTHALRQSAGLDPRYEDTQFTILLAALTMFGQSILGQAMFRIAGVNPNRATQQRFRTWFAQILTSHLQQDGQID
jgi:AcrR family transcriptional regulator